MTLTSPAWQVRREAAFRAVEKKPQKGPQLERTVSESLTLNDSGFVHVQNVARTIGYSTNLKFDLNSVTALFQSRDGASVQLIRVRIK